jgi:hypothetical protein
MSTVHSSLVRLAVVCLSTVLAQAQTITGPLVDPSGALVGGGEGYPWLMNPPRTLAEGETVGTVADLLRALGAAKSGQTIYVADGAELDLTGHWNIPIQAGVTLASGRGRHGALGALLYTSRYATDEKGRYGLFEVKGPAARITGLRLRGPDTGLEPAGCGGGDPMGIWLYSETPVNWPLLIDNNELWGWPRSAIDITSVAGVHVRHNHIHHNRRYLRDRKGCADYNFGYGVAAGGASDVLVDANLFDHNCHHITSDGKPGARYTARYNVCANGTIGHAFDVHGGADRREDFLAERQSWQPNDHPNLAGEWFWVQHNTFLQADEWGFEIRGLPRIGAFVYDNAFWHSDPSEAIVQTNASGNMFIERNRTIGRSPCWFVSTSADSFWRLRRFTSMPVTKTMFADFDGDRRTDAFASYGGIWYLSRAALGDWETINTSTIDPANLRFGDFNGDGRTDVFKSNGSVWEFSLSGTSTWKYLNTQNVPLAKLAFGDFDGDHRTDVFYADGAHWYVSYAGVSDFVFLNTSHITVESLRFAHFNRDGRTDVFYSDGSNWFVSFAGTGPWVHMNWSPVPLSELAFADFDGDNRTDVFYGDGTRWWTSSAAVGPAFPRQHSDFRTPSLGFGDFNGDGKADVLSMQSL